MHAVAKTKPAGPFTEISFSKHKDEEKWEGYDEIDQELLDELMGLENMTVFTVPKKSVMLKAAPEMKFNDDSSVVSTHSVSFSVSQGSSSSINVTSENGLAIRQFVKTCEKQSMKATCTIAQLYPDATILFADIAGFTAWSSIREAVQVFKLLEALFAAFDEVAVRHGVFKVETVGDCYVAVCGVPEPIKDHALIMALFARECNDKFYKVIRELEPKLGPDTANLAIRTGINSGPVTAGVISGMRARMQLFGDTVNTASRVETTGMRHRIHLSESTADLIVAAGYGDWVIPREDLVTAKGKGQMKTFWLKHKLPNETAEEEEENEEEEEPEFEEEDEELTEDEKALQARTQRCIDWNTDLLLKYLKEIVAHRNALREASRSQTRRRNIIAMKERREQKLKDLAATFDEAGLVVDEVADIIEMPRCDKGAIAASAESTVIPYIVIKQCREYVTLLASMYKNNPFHNFEHATHVAMSLHKLLDRITSPAFESDDLSVDEELDDEVIHELKHDHTYGITSDPLTQFASVLSALIHDADHRGLTNAQLKKEEPVMTEAYHNKCVAEQNSLDLCWEALMSDEFDTLRNFIYNDEDELRRFRQVLVNSVIATDIFDKEMSSLRKVRWDRAFEEEKCFTAKDKNRKATIVIEHLIQASDVAHTMQHFDVYKKWNGHLFEETYKNYVLGKTDKDPAEGWYKGELWFFDNYVIPLTTKLRNCGVFGVSSDEYLHYALANRKQWVESGEVIVEKFKDRCQEKYGTRSED